LNEPIFLTEDQIVWLHDEQITLFGGLAGPADPNLLGSSVAQPESAYYYGGKTSLFDLATEYAFSIAKNHAFADGNKRTASEAAIAFLDVNGWLVEEEFTEAMFDVVTDKISKPDFSRMLEESSVKKENKIIDLVDYLQELFRRQK
jgi:death-on-curing protein